MPLIFSWPFFSQNLIYSYILFPSEYMSRFCPKLGGKELKHVVLIMSGWSFVWLYRLWIVIAMWLRCPFILIYRHSFSRLWIYTFNEDKKIKVLPTYKEKGLVPGGIVVSSYGETLTCNREKNRLHLIDTDGKKGWKRLKKTDGLNMPYAICYSHSDNRLFVASCLQDTVAVYQLVLPTNPSCNNSIASS